MNNKPVPPSVGEFAVGERQQLVDRAVELERELAALAQSEHKLDTKGSRKALGAMNAKLRSKVGRLERELSVAQSERVVDALREAVEYLDDNRFNQIGAGSILHRTMRDALASSTGQEVKP